MNTPPPQRYVSTGRLPPGDLVASLVRSAHEQFRANADGENSQVYPALARVAPELFGICVVGVDGAVYAAGDAEHPFTIMSVSKPFVFALVAEQLGPDVVKDRVGANVTGLAFNSLAAIERGDGGRTNPMVNAGAIATTSLAPGASCDARWQLVALYLSQRLGMDLFVSQAEAP